MQEVAGERGGYLHGRGALDSDDLLYLKEQMEAEEDAERLLRRTEKRAFAAFKKAVAETSPASVPLPLRVEPKTKSGIRQQDLLKRVVEVKPKRQRVSSPSLDADGSSSTTWSEQPQSPKTHQTISKVDHAEKDQPSAGKVGGEGKLDNPVKSLLVAYESSEGED
ncbi:uncharacterized protein LOC127246135 isoform X2 [Andrographis paniculata]|nr:uncharacterized protein LOC127246135 isoform X2 [Andrographis paniculata]